MRKIFILVALLSLILGIFIGSGLYAKPDTYSMLRIFNRILKEIEGNYVFEVNSDSLMQGAIKGMIEVLKDPYTNYLNKEEYEAISANLKGEFGGIGATIGERDKKITVISPLEGTPAYQSGLLPGDAILKVDDVPTKGKSVDVVVKEIRGTPGTKVVLTIERQSLNEPFDVTITRAIIKLDAVLYFGMVDDDIGYVQLATFSRIADSELQHALDSLTALGAKKLILDLRLNAGGFLNEGVAVSEIFLPKGKEIVVTRGRIEKERVFASQKSSSYDDLPMVTLVDGGSASASEIVTGALQDWDRSLIIGTKTFGKGSAWKFFPLEGGGALTLTTDLWYTPAGRSINKPFESLDAEKDTTKVTERKEFTTLGAMKRKVYSEGGITPDIVIEPPKMTKLETDILIKGLTFDYAVQYTVKHKDLDKNLVVDNKMLREFTVFLLSKGLEFSEGQFDSIQASFRKRLQQDIFTVVWGMKEGYRVRVSNDPLVHQAIEYLKEVEVQQELFRFAGN